MKIEGSYVNKKGDTVTVSIIVAGSTGNDIAIEPDGVLEFAADDTVMIDSGVNDSLCVFRSKFPHRFGASSPSGLRVKTAWFRSKLDQIASKSQQDGLLFRSKMDQRGLRDVKLT